MIQIIPFRYSEQPEYLSMLVRGLADLANLRFNMVQIEAEINLDSDFEVQPEEFTEDLSFESDQKFLFAGSVYFEHDVFSVSLYLVDASQKTSGYCDTYQTTEKSFLTDWEEHLGRIITLFAGDERIESSPKMMYTTSMNAFLEFRRGLEILTQTKKQSKREEGLEHLLTAVAYDPEFIEAADILLLFLVQYDINHDYDYALKMLERLRAYATQHPRIPLVMAEIYFQCGNYSKVEQLLTALISDSPQFTEGWIRLALFYQYRNEPDRALAILQSFCDLQPDNVAVLDMMGAIYAGMEDHQHAEKVWLKTLELEPDRVNVLNNLGLLSEEKGNYDQAEEYYLKAIHLNDHWWGSYYNFGSFCYRNGRTEEGTFLLAKAKALNPGHYPTYFLLAECQVQLGYYVEAEEVLLALLQIAPNNAVRRQTLTMLEQLNQSSVQTEVRIRRLERIWEEGQYFKVIRLLLKDFGKARRLWYYWYFWSILLEECKLFTASKASLRIGYRLKPAFPVVKKLGLLYWTAGHYQKALPYLRNAFKLNHSDEAVARAYFQTLISLGEVEEYEQHRQQLSKVDHQMVLRLYDEKAGDY